MAKRPKSRRPGGGAAIPGIMLPTAERGRHDPVALVGERDPEGWPVTHARALDNIGRLLRDGTIEEAWASAGYLFRRDFSRAQFDPLRAADMAPLASAGRNTLPGD